MPQKQTYNLVFLHIPKNGGTTLHGILNRHYDPSTIFDIEVINNTRLNTQEFLELSLEDRSKIKLLKGHMLFGLHEHLVGTSKYITFLRKPEERILSFYNYVRSKPQHRLYEKLKNKSLYDFVATTSEGDVHNAQVRWVSGLEHESPESMLEKALENIEKHFSFVGLLEEYNTSLLLLSKLYGWGIPYYKHGKKGIKSNTTARLDQKTKEAIVAANQGDLKLYKLVAERFKKQEQELSFSRIKLKQLDIANYFYTDQTVKKVKTKFKKLINA